MNLLFIIQIILFASGTIFISLISYKSLRNVKVHGFYRFFVFEFSLVLILLNIVHWFNDPLSLQQIVSWILLMISLLFLVQSFYFFKKYSSRENRDDYPANFEFENTSSLIKQGIYKYIRHPMYGSLLFLAFGAMLKYVSIITISLAVIILVFIIFTAKIEEKENIKFFGSVYEDYMKETKMFIPFVI